MPKSFLNTLRKPVKFYKIFKMVRGFSCSVY